MLCHSANYRTSTDWPIRTATGLTKRWEVATFTALVDQAVSSWTQTFVADLQVVANVRAAAVVVQALVGS